MIRRCLVPLFATLFALGFVAVDSWQRWAAVEFVNRVPVRADAVVLTEEVGAPTGYALGRRAAVLPYYVDCYNWIQQTQTMLAEGSWRIRHVGYDRVPGGREVHWSGSFRWWLALLATMDHRFNDVPLPIAVERVAPWANPLLFALALVILVAATGRKFGGEAAAIAVLGAVAVYDIYQNFLLGNADHHGMVLLCALGVVFSLLAGGAGWVRERENKSNASKSRSLDDWLPSRVAARRWFGVSAAFGATGLWISAATMVPILLGIGFGGVWAGGWLARPPREAAKGDSTPSGANAMPQLWLEWGAMGAGLSVGFYLLEYFPAHLGWRLEVNHPFHAVAWAGGGGAMWLVCRWLRGDADAAPRARPALWLTAVAALALLPTVILLTKTRTFVVADPFLWKLHEHFIAEFRSLARHLALLPLSSAHAAISALPLVGLPLLWLACSRGVGRPVRAMFALIVPAGVLMTLLGFSQVRWLGIANAVWLTGLIVLVWQAATLPRAAWTKARAALVFAALVLVLAPHPLRAARVWFLPPTPTATDYFQSVVRDVAHWLRQRVGEESVAILSGPSAGSLMAYHGGFQAQGSLYWENLAGLKDAAAIFSADTPGQAKRLMEGQGIDYLVIVSWDAFDQEYAMLARDGDAAAGSREAFVNQIIRSRRLPKWLRPLPYPSHLLPQVRAERDFFLGVFEVVPEQSDVEAAVQNARFLLGIGEPGAARSHVQVALSAEPNNVPALLTQAMMPGVPAEEIAERLRSMAISPARLQWTDQVELALLWARVGDTVRARAQFGACWASASERELRRLRPEACHGLIDAARNFGIDATANSLAPFAFTLLPSSRQAEVLFAQALSEHLAGRLDRASVLYRQAIARLPDYTSALNNLAHILATAPRAEWREGAEAVEFGWRAARRTQFRDAGVLHTLACAQAEAGDFGAAERTVKRALALARQQQAPEIIAACEAHLALFKARRPFHDAPPPAR